MLIPIKMVPLQEPESFRGIIAGVKRFRLVAGSICPNPLDLGSVKYAFGFVVIQNI